MSGKIPWNKGLSKETDSRISQQSKTLSNRYRNKEIKSVGCCAWSKEQRSSESKKQQFGGYRPNSGRSKKFISQDSYGSQVVLQSTFELKCSIILNELKIKWIRPKSIKYDNNKRYFPDFYLVDYNIYLDPKNSYKAIQDKEKIEKVQSQNNIKVYVLLEENITKEFIANVVQW